MDVAPWCYKWMGLDGIWVGWGIFIQSPHFYQTLVWNIHYLAMFPTDWCFAILTWCEPDLTPNSDMPKWPKQSLLMMFMFAEDLKPGRRDACASCRGLVWTQHTNSRGDLGSKMWQQRKLQVFNPATERWRVVGDLTSPRRGLTLAVRIILQSIPHGMSRQSAVMH